MELGSIISTQISSIDEKTSCEYFVFTTANFLPHLIARSVRTVNTRPSMERPIPMMEMMSKASSAVGDRSVVPPVLVLISYKRRGNGSERRSVRSYY